MKLGYRKMELRDKLEKDPNNEKLILEYLKVLTAIEPHETVTFLEKSWTTQKLPVNEVYLKEYLKAVSSLKKIDGLNIGALLTLIQKQKSSGVLSTESDPANIMKLLQSGISNGGGSVFTAGASPRQPLYIATQEASWRSQTWRLMRYTVLVFIGFSLLGTLLDEKGAASGKSN